MLHGRFGELKAKRLEGVQKYAWEPYSDVRGTWQRIWDVERFDQVPLSITAVQVSVSTNPLKGTLRGLHYLDESASEWKAVVCVQGSIQDVIVDMRNDSPTKGLHDSFILSGSRNEGILIPPGCAHGFLTLEPNCILIYLMTARYDAGHERALRWNDPTLGIDWVLNPELVSDKDRGIELI